MCFSKSPISFPYLSPTTFRLVTESGVSKTLKTQVLAGALGVLVLMNWKTILKYHHPLSLTKSHHWGFFLGAKRGCCSLLILLDINITLLTGMRIVCTSHADPVKPESCPTRTKHTHMVLFILPPFLDWKGKSTDISATRWSCTP